MDGVTAQTSLATLPADTSHPRNRWLLFALIGVAVGVAGDRLALTEIRTADIASPSGQARAAAFSRIV